MEESTFSHLMVLVVFLIFVGLNYKSIKRLMKDEVDG